MFDSPPDRQRDEQIQLEGRWIDDALVKRWDFYGGVYWVRQEWLVVALWRK